jgi:hypothetical protein
MSKKKKAQIAEHHEVNNEASEEQNQMEVTNNMAEEVTPATIVEASEEQVFATQTGLEAEGTTETESSLVESPEAATEGLETQVVEQTAQPENAEETPAPKPRVNKRPYIGVVTEHLEAGDMDRKALVSLVLKEFPAVKKGGVETFLTDTLNPKYSYFKERVVTKSPNGKLIFADRLIPGVIVAEQDEAAGAESTGAEIPPAEAVAPEAVQPEQAAE